MGRSLRRFTSLRALRGRRPVPSHLLYIDCRAAGGAGAAAGAAGGEDADGAGLGQELRTSVVSLIEAMRDLLTNLSPVPATVDEDADLDESGDEDAWRDED